jgi:hypothetical protein
MRRLFRILALAAACAGPLRAASLPAQPAKAQSPDPAQARAQIDEVLHQISAAVVAADQAQYLSHVLRTDPCFSKEQENWAKDLGRKAPQSFEVALTDAELTLTDDGAEGRIRWSWTMPGRDERTLSFIARFVRSSSGWLYAGEKWHILEGDHCRVSYEEGLEEAAKLVTEVLPEVRAHVHEGFELTEDKDLTERIQQVKLYTSMRHLQQSIYLSYTDGLDGWNEPGEAVKVLCRSRASRSSLRTLLGHEYGHVATFQLGPKATDMPWWILEGVAELSAEQYARDDAYVNGTVRHWAANDGLVAWDRLADFHGEAVKHGMNVYIQGHHMLGYISIRFGRAGRNRWLRAMAQGVSLEDATAHELGLSFADLDRDWRESLRATPKPAPGGDSPDQ